MLSRNPVLPLNLLSAPVLGCISATALRLNLSDMILSFAVSYDNPLSQSQSDIIITVLKTSLLECLLVCVTLEMGFRPFFHAVHRSSSRSSSTAFPSILDDSGITLSRSSSSLWFGSLSSMLGDAKPLRLSTNERKNLSSSTTG
ncbi:hypothetical protein EX30DRAFT_338094 [Ascodesmis nigricans]|uniref:Uncharacterized protein n=1 Tax=Ascodesmis nigricans TaxID=341454 RepID=A0A4S2N327_9PEZI|nr:hypothetical protein EX30DRAFT_338094 [Ascodesmis nigricans]